MLDVCKVWGLEGVDIVSVFPQRAAPVFSHIHVSICVQVRREVYTLRVIG